MPEQSCSPAEGSRGADGEAVCLCLGHETNRRMLASELEPEYRVTAVDSLPPNPEFALYIVDELGLEQCYEDLRAIRQAAEPILRPCLLVTNRDVERIDSAVWELVDDIITTPVSIAELHPRVDSLLRLHRLSVDYDQRRQLEQVASILSHDLRNPLSVAQGNLEIAREDGDAESFERTAQALGRIEALIGDVLTLVRQDYSASDFEMVPVADLAREAWDEFDAGGCTFDVAMEARTSVRANRSALKELFTNLYRNAKDHNNTPIRVTLGALPDGFYVADNGVGIPEAAHDRVFESGYSTQSDGTGLGLSIVEHVASAHGWDVSVTSSETGGARFEVTTASRAQTDSKPTTNDSP